MIINIHDNSQKDQCSEQKMDEFRNAIFDEILLVKKSQHVLPGSEFRNLQRKANDNESL